MRTPRVTAVQIVRVSRWKGGGGGGGSGEEAMPETPFSTRRRNAKVWQEARTRLVIRPNYPSNPINPRRDRETGEPVHGLHTSASCMHNAGEEERGVDSSSSNRIGFHSSLLFPLLDAHPSSVISLSLFSLHDVLLVINFFFSPFQFRQDVRVYIFIFISNV